MHILILSFLLCTTVVKSDDETKYIDMLPEKEKEEFLETIARRILDEVETKTEKLKDSKEVSAEQLNKHDDFVRKILQEESANLKKQVNDSDAKFDLNPNKLYVPPVLRKEEENKNQQYVDLTLRVDKNRSKTQDSRKVFTGYVSDGENSTKHKDKGLESELDVQVRNFRRNAIFASSDLTTLSEIQTTEEIQTTTSNEYFENNETSTINPTYENNQQQTEFITETVPDDKNISITEILSSEIIKTTDPYDDVTETTTIDTTENIFTAEETATENVSYDVIQKTFHPFENTSVEDIKTGIANNLHENDNLRAYSLHNLEETVILRSSSTTENGNNTEDMGTNIDNFKLLTSLNNTSAKYDNSANSLNDSTVINIDVITVTPVEKFISNNTNNENQSSEQTTPKTQPLTTSISTEAPDTNCNNTANVTITLNNSSDCTHAENEETKSVIEESKSKTSTTNMTKDTKVFLNQVMESLRDNLIINGKTYEDNAIPKPPFKEYRVYELAPGASPFVKKETLKKKLLHKSKALSKVETSEPKPKQLKSILKMKESELQVKEAPYYVPIYNYQPENAFYDPRNKDDEDETAENGDMKGNYLLPSMKPNPYDDHEVSANDDPNNQPMNVPIYVYSPENAFYNPNDVYSLSNKDQITTQDKNNIINKNPDIEYTEEYEDNDDKETNTRDQIEWQYYNDPHKKQPENIKILYNKKLKKDKLSLDNLSQIIKDILLTDGNQLTVKNKHGRNTTSDILSNDLDWYSKKQKAFLRCLYKKQCGKGNDQEDSKEKSNEDSNITDSEMFDTTMSKARHMLLASGHFTINKKGNFSKLDQYFASAENSENDKDNNDDKDNKEPEDDKEQDDNKGQDAQGNDDDDDKIKRNSKSKRNKRRVKIKRAIRALLDQNDHLDKKTGEKGKNIDIAMDYYFDKPKSKRDRKQKDDTAQKLALILNKNHHILPKEDEINTEEAKIQRKEAKSLRVNHKPPRKTDKQYEYQLIKDLAEELPDNDIEKLYWQLEFIDQLVLRNSKLRRSGELDAFIEVLGDMVKENNKALRNYDWLGTTVELQSAVTKMADMVESARNDEPIHPSDLELLKYLVWVHTYAQNELGQSTLPKELRGIKIPTSKKHRGRIIKELAPIYRALIDRLRPKPIPDDELESFQEFLRVLQNSLYDLHTALKYIAMVTKYKDQHWFENLKQIHLEVSKKRILELIIHLSTTRLLGLVEESAKSGLEDNFKKYVKQKKNEKEVDRTVEEFVFLLQLLDEFKRDE